MTLGVADRRKLRCDELSGKVLLYGKVEGRSLVEFLWVKVGTEVGPSDRILDRKGLQKILVGSWTIKMDGSPLGQSLGTEHGDKGGSSGDIYGGELEGLELGESVTEV